MDGIVFFGIFLFLGTTGWILYKLNVTRRIKKSMREKEAIEEVALLIRFRNVAGAVFLYSLSCVCFLAFSLSKMSPEHAQYYQRLHIIEFLVGVCVAAIGFAIASHLMQNVVVTQLKQRVRQRAWTLKFWRGIQKSRRGSLIKRN